MPKKSSEPKPKTELEVALEKSNEGVKDMNRAIAKIVRILARFSPPRQMAVISVVASLVNQNQRPAPDTAPEPATEQPEPAGA